MAKVLVVGAGTQGGPCASILAGEENVSEIRLGDIDLDTAQKVAAKIGSAKTQPLKLDASNLDEVISLASGVDVILNEMASLIIGVCIHKISLILMPLQ